MCNVVGYVGGRQAAPILVEMLRRQESTIRDFQRELLQFIRASSTTKEFWVMWTSS